MWSPSQDRLDRANLSRFMRFVREEVGNADLNSYAVLYRFSIDQPAKFWTLLWDFVGIRGLHDAVDQAVVPLMAGFPYLNTPNPGAK